MQAEAIDIRLPRIPTSELRDAALRLHRGGVGYYRSSDFVRRRRARTPVVVKPD
jgi:uncharacterized protein YcbK (DUF882 family)